MTVDAQRFYWRALGGDWFINVVIVTDAAFVSGHTAQQLRFRLSYDQLRTACPGGSISLHQRAAITPAVVRRAIELSRERVPAFSGDLDLADVELSGSETHELQELARLEPPSFSCAPGLMALGVADRELILACLRAVVDGPFIPDWEFPTLFGIEREAVRALVAEWPTLNEADNTTYLAINNALVNLVGYPHGQDAALKQMCGADRTEIDRVYRLWREASQHG